MIVSHRKSHLRVAQSTSCLPSRFACRRESSSPKARFIIIHRCIICPFTGVTTKNLRWPPSCVILPLSLFSQLFSRPPEETADSFCSAAGILSNTDADKFARWSKRAKRQKKVGYTRANHAGRKWSACWCWRYISRRKRGALCSHNLSCLFTVECESSVALLGAQVVSYAR